MYSCLLYTSIWGSWARYVYEVNPERFAQFATNVFDIPCGTDYKETALAGIVAMENFFRSVEMPTSLHELGLDLTDQQIHDLAFKCSFEDTRTIGAVSYTHLDVYKRQVPERCRHHPFQNRQSQSYRHHLQM